MEANASAGPGRLTRDKGGNGLGGTRCRAIEDVGLLVNVVRHVARGRERRTSGRTGRGGRVIFFRFCGLCFDVTAGVSGEGRVREVVDRGYQCVPWVDVRVLCAVHCW